jgi:hypothetical protein
MLFQKLPDLKPKRIVNARRVPLCAKSKSISVSFLPYHVSRRVVRRQPAKKK